MSVSRHCPGDRYWLIDRALDDQGSRRADRNGTRSTKIPVTCKTPPETWRVPLLTTEPENCSDPGPPPTVVAEFRVTAEEMTALPAPSAIDGLAPSEAKSLADIGENGQP